MRIVCPNCTSQYEVSEEAIPETGRDVQCAKCSNIWFQTRPMQLGTDEALIAPASQPASAPQPTPTAPSGEGESVFRSRRAERPQTPPQMHSEPEPTPEPQMAERPRPAIDPEVQRILREEAEFAAHSTPTSYDDVPSPEATPPVEESTQEAAAPEQTQYVQDILPDAEPDAEDIAPQIDADRLSRVMEKLDDAQEQSTRPSDGVTLASAKSLREILEAESIESIDITESQPTPNPDHIKPEEPVQNPPRYTPTASEPDTTEIEDIAPNPPQDTEVYLGDLGKRPIQIHRDPIMESTLGDGADDVDDIDTDVDDEIENGPMFVAASRPLIRPASDFIKSASNPLNDNKPLTKNTQTEPAKPVLDEPTIETEIIKPDIKLAPTSQASEGRAAFTDIDDINASLDLDEDDIDIDLGDADDIDITEPTNRFSMGFLAACGVAIVMSAMYLFAPTIAGKVPATQTFLTQYEGGINNGRMVLQDMYYQGGEPGFSTLFQNAKNKFLN